MKDKIRFNMSRSELEATYNQMSQGHARKIAALEWVEASVGDLSSR
jgi:hypothetical protein